MAFSFGNSYSGKFSSVFKILSSSPIPPFFLFLDVLLDRYKIPKIDTLFSYFLSYLLSILFTWYSIEPFFSECLRLATLASSANLLAMYSFRSHSRNAESEFAFNQILQVILCTMQFEKHISRITVHLCFSHYVELLNFYYRIFNVPMILFRSLNIAFNNSILSLFYE